MRIVYLNSDPESKAHDYRSKSQRPGISGSAFCSLPLRSFVESSRVTGFIQFGISPAQANDPTA